MQILYITLGSALGGTLRFLCFNLLPIGILGNLLIVNSLGSFCIGFLTHFLTDENLKLFFLVGFLGSFTTFSTFSFEIFTLLSSNKILLAISYIFISVAIGIFGVWGGMATAKIF